MAIDTMDAVPSASLGTRLRGWAQSPTFCLMVAPVLLLGLCMYLLDEFGAGFVALLLVGLACGIPCLVAKDKFRAAEPREQDFEITFTSTAGR